MFRLLFFSRLHRVTLVTQTMLFGLLGLCLLISDPSYAAAPSALSFNGTSSYVSVPNHTSLQLLKNFTLEAWINPSSVSGHRHIFGKNQYELSVEPLNTGFRVKFEISTNGSWKQVSSGQYTFNQWHHVAGTYNGSVMRLFVNGVLVASRNVKAM